MLYLFAQQFLQAREVLALSLLLFSSYGMLIRQFTSFSRVKFGLHAVNMTDGEYTRTPKASAKYLAALAADNAMYEGQDLAFMGSGSMMLAGSFALFVASLAMLLL